MIKFSKISISLIALIGLHLYLLVNLQFTAWPEMSSFPYLYSKGFLIYKDFVQPYPPLLTLMLAGVYNIFGYKLIVLKFFTWLLIIINDIFIYLIVKKITRNTNAEYLSIIFYILTQPFLNGDMLWFDTAITTPILISVYFFIRSFETKLTNSTNLVYSSAFSLLALLIKQTSLAFIAMFIFVIIFFKKNFKDLFAFLTPIFVFLTGLFYWLIKNGSLEDFINWNFNYPSKYWTYYPSYVILSLSHHEMMVMFLILSPSIFLFIFKFKEILNDKNNLVIYLLLISAVIAVYPRFSFYHFQTALAFCAIIFGVFINYFNIRGIFTICYFLLLISLISLPIIKTDWQKDTRFWSESDIKLAKIISDKTGDGSVYLIGPHSGLYVLSGKVPPKPWLDNFGWYFEIPQVQEQTINSWQLNPPGAIFIQDAVSGPAYQIGTYQPKKILSWIKTNYTRKEEVAPGIWYWQINKK